MARPRSRPPLVAVCLAWAACALAADPACAQETRPMAIGRRIAIDSVIGVQDFFGEVRDWPTQVVFDTFMTAEPRRGWQISFRPKLWRTGGTWEVLVDHASVRYEFRRGSNWRVEAGIFPSPIGYAIMENRPSINAGGLWWHRPYYMPLPRLAPGFPQTSLVSTVYPAGLSVSTSARRWDARAAIVSRAPVQFWHGEPLVPQGAHTIVGGGITPRQGMRIGVGGAWGEAARGKPGIVTPRYRMLNVEGEWAFGHTKVSGEWVRDRFALAAGPAIARGWTLQAQHTLAPRVFAHARTTFMSSPDGTIPAAPVLRTYRSLDSTLGYRVDPELTVRLSHAAMKSFSRADVDHQIGLSVMWTRRWW